MGQINKIIMNRLIEYLSEYGACQSGIESLTKYSTPQEAWDNVEPEYLIWATIETNLVSDEDKKRFARWCALSVAHLWYMPEVVQEYLESGDERLRDEAQEATWRFARVLSQSRETPRMIRNKKVPWAELYETAWREARDAAWRATVRAAWEDGPINDTTWDAASAASWAIAWSAPREAAWREAWSMSREAPWTVSEAREAARTAQAAWIRENIKPDWSVII